MARGKYSQIKEKVSWNILFRKGYFDAFDLARQEIIDTITLVASS